MLLALGCAPLAFRRRWPIAVLSLVGAIAAAAALRDLETDMALALAIASFTAAGHVERARFQRLVLPIAFSAAVVSLVVAYPRTNWVEVAVGATFTVGLPMIFGRIGFNRRRRIVGDQARAASDAVVAERARIARELHDVVAHAMSVMVVQAGAARSVVDRDIEAAKAAIVRIEETGREGMNEMRRLIGILKEEAAEADLNPQPGLDQLETLLETIRGAGVPVEAIVQGEPRPVPPGVDLTAYRVVQEALTNVIKHGGRSNARVVVHWGIDVLEIEVSDDGRGLVPHGSVGLGLIGMRERLALFGGSLETGARGGGGFVVRAELPLEEAHRT